MGFFTLGNLVTLGIVGLILFLYRQLDRQNHALNKVHRYADKLRTDLADFVAEKEAAVKDYGISLDVQQKSAKELMKRLQMTNEELALKAAAVAKIDERISAYDSSLEELVRMTARVQENLNRIREESGFVEHVHKRVGDAKEKFVAVEKGLGELERRFERENTDALEKTARSLAAEVQSQVSDFQAAAAGIAQRVTESREAIEQAERIRSEQVARDLETITNALTQVMEQIAAKADTLEDAALGKLREQAQARIQQLQTTIDETLTSHQEQAQAQVAEFQQAVAAYKHTWNHDTEVLESQQRAYKDALEKDVQELSSQIQAQREAWTQAVEAGNVQIRNLFADIRTLAEESKEQVTEETAAMEQRLKDVQESTQQTVHNLEDRLLKTVGAAEQRVLKLTDERLEQWKLVTAKAEDASRNLLTDLERASEETKQRVTAELMAMEQQCQGVQAQTLEALGAMEQRLTRVTQDTEQRVLKLTDERLEHWKLVTAEADANTQQMLSALELSTTEIEAHFAAETAAQEQRLRDIQRQTDEALLAMREQILKAAADAEVQVFEDAGARLEQWKAAAEAGDAQSRELLTAFELSVGELKAQVTSETAAVEQRLKEVQSHTDEAISALKHHVVQAAEEAQAKVWADTGARLEQWTKSVEERDHQARQILSDLEAVSAETERHTADALAGMEGRVAAIQTKIDETVAQVAGELAQAVGAAEKQAQILADAEREQWNRVVAEAGVKIRQECSKLEASLADTKQQVSDELTGVFDQCKTVQDQFQETVFRIKAELAQAVGAAEEQVHTLTDAELNRWQRASEEGDAKAQALLAELERVSGETKAQVLAELDAAEGRLETMRQRIQEIAVAMEAKMLTAMEDTKDQALAQVQAELEQWNRSAEQVHIQAENLRSNIETLATESAKNLAALESRWVTMAAEAEQRVITAGDNRLEQWRLVTAEADTHTRAALAALETATAETKTQLAAEQATLTQGLQELHGYADERFAALKIQVAQMARDTEEQVSAGMSAAEGRLDALQRRLNETAAEIDQGMAQAISAAEERALVMADHRLAQWKQTVEAEDTHIQGLLADLNASFEETQRQVADELAVTENRLNTLRQRLDDTASEIDQGMVQAVASAGAKAQVLADAEREKWKAAVEAEDIKTKALLAALEGSFEKTKQHIADELTVTDERMDGIQLRLEEASGLIEHEMAQAVDTAAEKALVIADERFEQWSQATVVAEAKTQAMLAALEGSFEQTKQQVADELAAAEGQMHSLRQRLDETAGCMDQALAQALDTAAAKARAEADEGLQQWKQTAEEQEAIARQSLAEVERGLAAIKGQIEDTITAAEQRLQALQNRIDETASAIEQELSQTVSAAEAKARAAAEAEREQWKQAAEAEDTKTQALLSALEASLTHSQQQVSDAIAQTGQELERLHDRIGEATTRIDQEMAQALSIAEAKARTMGDMHFETWKQAAEEQAATARQILTAMEGSFADTKRQIGDDLTAAEQQFQALQNRIDETAATIEQELSQVVSAAEAKARAAAEAEREQWKQSVEAADTKTQTLLAALEAVSEATKTQAAQEHTAIEARLQEVQAYTDGAIGMVRSQVEQTLRDTEQQILQDAQAKLEPWKQAVQEEDTKAQTLLAALEVAAAETKVRLDAEGTALEQRLTAFQGYTDESISVLRTQVAQKLQDMDQQAREHTDAQLTAWTQTLQAADTKARAELAALEASLAHTKQQVSDTITAVEQQFQALQNRIGEGASHIEQELVQAVGTAEAKARVLADAGLEQWKQTTAIEEAKARQILTDMEKSFAQTRQQAGEALASAEQRVETLQTKMDAAASQLEHTMTQVLGNTETQARAMADTGLEQWRAAMEVEAAAAQGLLSTLETTATETKAQVAAEQAALEQRLKDVQGYAEAAFAGLKAQVEQTLKDMEQQVLDDAQVQLEHWKQTAAEEDAKTQALLSALEATSAEAKTYLEAENDALEQRLKDLRLYADEAIDALRTQVEAQLEQVRQTVAAEDAQAHALLSAMETSFADTKRQASDEIAVAERYLETLQSRMSETAAFIEDEMARTVERAEAQALAANQEGIQRWNQAVETSHTQIRQMLADLEASARGIEQNMLNETESVKQRLQDMRTYTDDSLIQLQQRLRDLTEETEQRVLEDADAKFEEYRKAQAEQFERMEALADDSSALDTELRRYLQDLETRVREDFARFERQARLDQDKVAGEFNVSSTALRSELEGIENELATLKTQAYEQVSAGLRIFEDAFAADLTKRSSDIDQQLTAWQQTLDTRLTDIGVAAEAQRREVELRFNDTLQTKLAEEDGRIKAELERLHREAENFETEIRAQMHGVDETITAFKGQLQQDMDEAHQKTQALLTESDERLGALRTAIEQVAAEAGAQQATVFSHIDTQAKTLEAAIAEADQHIKEFTAQTQLFEQADMLKRELDQRIAGLTADFDRLDKRRAETADMEDQFTKLKRLEEDVNAKMTRFLSEKHRIEQIETGFNRLLLVSEAVEDKLTAVSASNDTLQEMQIQIRKLTDALENAEEKYQRIEKKNQALDVTNDGIDRNFRALQESEKMAQYITDDLHRLSDETGALRAALETLTTENKKARETADKLSLLDQSLSSIEERIEDMQKARKWLAELETRLEKLNKEAQDQVKLMGGLMKDPSKIAPQDKGAPPLGVRDNIIRLARLGWTVDEIARAVKCGKGEVELILEIMPKE